MTLEISELRGSSESTTRAESQSEALFIFRDELIRNLLMLSSSLRALTSVPITQGYVEQVLAVVDKIEIEAEYIRKSLK